MHPESMEPTMRAHRAVPLALTLILTACAGGSTDVDTAQDDVDDDTLPPLECEPPGESACGNEGAIVRGVVALPPGHEGPTEGTLFVAMAHEWLGNGALAGVPHAGGYRAEVDLADGPVPFEIDMCSGGAMWSEENCSYQVFAILDTDGDQGMGNLLPGPDELTGRVQDVSVSCHAESACHEIIMDCIGPECLQFADPGTCTCDDTNACPSDYVTCQ